MKKFIVIIGLLMIITGCEEEQETTVAPVSIPTEQDSIHNYRGNFIMAGNSAVLKGNQFVFQVKMDSTAVRLRDSIQGLKLKNGAVIPMEVRGKVNPNPMPNGYSQLIEIKEILTISVDKKNIEEKN